MDYDAYGNIIRDSIPDFTIPFGFAGGLHDPDPGLSKVPDITHVLLGHCRQAG
ncbi:MAG: hypothetical protein JJT90_17340 [Ectothiorhodospiraceae bacterium]|nr:hypothetical protein [Ectothiorhodospiraceae bacterium]